jgi:succinate-acetate transporter protein
LISHLYPVPSSNTKEFLLPCPLNAIMAWYLGIWEILNYISNICVMFIIINYYVIVVVVIIIIIIIIINHFPLQRGPINGCGINDVPYSLVQLPSSVSFRPVNMYWSPIKDKQSITYS